MNHVSITSPFSGGVTIIPNQFIEHYMIHANGEFVKIYLYLMYLSENGSEASLNQIADALNCTESDVQRALKYWEKEELLSILPVNSRKPESLSLLMPMVPASRRNAASTETASVNLSAEASSVFSDYSDTDSLSSEKESNQDSTAGKTKNLHSKTAAAQAFSVDPTHGTLTPDKVKKLKENESIAELLFIAQQYMGKPLSPSDTNRILYFYDELKFSTDLIEYLIEYCVNKGHRSMNYIEKVAFAWKQEGITNTEDAKKSCENYHKDYYTILKALGIRGRNPIDAEVAIMRTWIQEYGFSLDIIIEACTRTILATKQPSLQYADRILQIWKEANVHTISDIQKLDYAHEQNKTEKPTRKKAQNTDRFSNFEQRSYDYSSLESQLLNR